MEPTIQKFLIRVEEFAKCLDSDSMISCPKIPQEEFSQVYNTVYEMCNQQDPNNHTDQVWNAYEDILKSYFNTYGVADLQCAQKSGLPQRLLKV